MLFVCQCVCLSRRGSIFVYLQDRWHVVLHCHPQLGINKKDKAENIKSFGNIFSDLLDGYQNDHDD